MSNIYQFPQGQDRQRFKSAVKHARSERKRSAAKNTLFSWAASAWFYSRLAVAFAMTTVVLFVINLLYSFRKVLTFLTVVLGLILYYTTYEHHFYKGNDFTLLFCIGLVIIAQSGLGLNILMIRYQPFLRLFRVNDTKESSDRQRLSSEEP
ncbi:hypothetical protein [Serratia ureilytica]|uniref:hypothetical protein n=1 Tax=Serratia ureilytica TaxID=300181 RepID=UPI0018E8225C|nr:hypothetical protein [Serratia ureilytica]MBJ2083113.1 hypothetical protein [Serratia ureilytica]